jgi:Na+/melibiose symporter-like transporter
MTPGNLVFLVILVLFMAASLAAHSIVWPLIADIIDYEEYETNVRREGSFYGTYIFASNIASALGILVAGIMLTAIGLESGVEVTSKMVNWLKISFGPGVGMWSLFGIIFISFLKYNKDEQKKIAAELEEMRANQLV